MLVLPLFNGLDASVLAVDDAGPGSAGSQWSGHRTWHSRSGQDRPARTESRRARPARPRPALLQQGLDRLEGRLVDDNRDFVLDDLGLRLALAVTLPIKLVEGPDAGVARRARIS